MPASLRSDFIRIVGTTHSHRRNPHRLGLRREIRREDADQERSRNRPPAIQRLSLDRPFMIGICQGTNGVVLPLLPTELLLPTPPDRTCPVPPDREGVFVFVQFV